MVSFSDQIKFFERIKVERFIKQLKKGAEGRERTAAEEKKLAELQADLQVRDTVLQGPGRGLDERLMVYDV